MDRPMLVYIDGKKGQEAQLLLEKPIVLRTTYGVAADRCMVMGSLVTMGLAIPDVQMSPVRLFTLTVCF